VSGAEWTDEDLRAAERELEESIVASYGPAEKWQPKSNNASRCGHPCAYYLWSARARVDDLPGPDEGMPGIWSLGREAEKAAKIALLQEGWDLHSTEVTFEDPDLDLRGKLDWELSRKGGVTGVWDKPIPTEFKGVSANYIKQLNSFEDCFNSSMHWVRLWPMQTLVYAYLMPKERPLVCLLMRNKTNARPKAILARTERYFDRLLAMGEVLAEVNVALRDGTEPTAITYDPTWCKDCDAAHICPTMQKHTYGTKPVVLEDPVVFDGHAINWAAGQAAKKDSETAWEHMKDICRHHGLYDAQPGEERFLVGAAFKGKVKINKAGQGKLTVEPIVIDPAEEDTDNGRGA
jgi:hypothetical protein